MMSCPNLNALVWQHLFRNARRLPFVWKSGRSIVPNGNSFSTETKEIVIPNYIPRGPTDILEALASTVKRDPTAPHFKFHDDPYLIPASNHAKRTYALAQEAGRKAANWIKHEHAELFQHRNAEPFIQAFAPAEKLTETTPITEDLLKKYIHTAQVANAIHVYGKLDSAAISPETRQSFLEFVAFYNEDDQLNQDFVEERWFKSGMKGKDQIRQTWKNNGLAEAVFNSMERKTPEAYCALICGMAKHGKAVGAWEYYNQMLAEGFAPNLTTYNSIFKIAGIVREDAEHQIRLIDETLRNMVHAGIKPNVRTLNSILESISRIPIYRVAREKSLQVLSDFKSIGVKPSLGSYYFLLKIFCREKGPINNILVGIVNRLEYEMPPLQDLHDVAFFAEAMRVCNYHLEDVQLAKRLHDLLCLPQNQALIGDSYKESIYYRCFLLLLTRAEGPEALMEMYRHLVPNIYTPEQSVFEAVVKSVAECSAVHYVPELWSDAVYMDMGERESILEVLLEALASGSGPDSNTVSDKDDVDPVLATARAITAHVDNFLQVAEEKNRPTPLRWTGSMLGNLAKLFLQYGDVASANAIIIKVHTLKNQLSSFFPVATLNKFYESCIERQDSAMALMAIDYAVEMGYDESSSMAKQAREQLKLDERQQEKLNSILGSTSTTSEES
ncbi:protein PTCD3 homolog, mitochondrial isoform X1 [Daphnia magna]|uniref:Small ribosomal subunit protein mS39 n=1 Tax=Daphnia magna TaxID=35525 RepID=A0A164UB27_9CRUS|nr:protein PTCD3 homolog, mitochondrial isoform X1 [Daphnia magna]KZS11201.1 Protein PTCD3, mitochondrial [Daphnia magna]